MRPTPRYVLLASVVVLAGAWGFVRIRAVGAQEALQSAKSARGGLLAKTAHHQFEVFFFPTGVRVLAETAAGQPVDASRATGTATFYHPNSPQPWFSRPLRGTSGQAPASLELVIGLGNAPAVGGKVTFELSGLSDPAEPTASFTVPLEFVATPSAGSTAARHPAPPQGGTATVPRYTYGPGYYGYGYYPYSSPTPASPPASSYFGYSNP